MKNKFAFNFKYRPAIPASIAFMVVIAGSLFLFFGRHLPAIRIAVLLRLLPDFYQHVSNFSLSLAVLIIVGFSWLLMGVSFRYILFTALFMVAMNFVCELWVRVLNTPDIVDAYYGTAGVLLGTLFLLLVGYKGLKRS